MYMPVPSMGVYRTDSAIEAVLVGCIRVVGDRISDCCRNMVREANHAAQYNQRFSPSESYGEKESLVQLPGG